MNERYPGARRAVLKTGGDFPFLSRPDEVNLYLQLHLRRVGVEPRPDLVQGFTRNGSAGSSKDQKDGGNNFDNHPGDNGGPGSGGHDHETQNSGSESHDSDESIPTSTMLANTILGTVSSTLQASLCVLLIHHYYESALYISSRQPLDV